MKKFISDPEKFIFIADGAQVLGDVSLEEYVGIWYNAVIRGDAGKIFIGKGSNIQDNCVLHTDLGYTVTIGEGVTIGHGAIVHGCSIGDHTLVGMGSIILNGASIGKNCIIGAGALVTGNTVIPSGSLAFGNPARVIRKIKKEELEKNIWNATHYAELARQELMKEQSEFTQ